MYHELLLALGGFSGDLFKLESDVMKVSKEFQLSFIHNSERMSLDETLEVAGLYIKLNTFVENYQRFSVNKDELNPGNGFMVGIYIGGLCNGVDEILKKYLQVLTELELDIIENPCLTVNDIRVRTSPFVDQFKALLSILNIVKNIGKSSALIIEHVKSVYDSNVHLQKDLQILAPGVNRPLLNQIINWVAFGNLIDTKKEFFIQKNQDGHLYVDYSIVPSHFPIPLTDRILFIGNSISVLEKTEKTKCEVREKQKEFFNKLSKISINTFRIEELSETIEGISDSIGKDLHYLVVAETDLMKHIRLVKDFFLTGRGELFQDFLFNMKNQVFVKNSANAEIEKNFALSANRVQVQDDILQKINISIKKPEDLNRDNLTTIVSRLKIGISYEWPLHILFTKESDEKYNELFCFLLSIRLVQLQLNDIWVNTRKIFRFPIPKGPAELKNIMSFFLDHLQHYLQEDVLETQYNIFTSKVEKSKNFEQIRMAHEFFQSNILSQSFRTNPRVRHFIEKLLIVCGNFVKYMTSCLILYETKGSPINEGSNADEIKEISKEFRNYMQLLLGLFKGLAMNHSSGKFLGQFLLRLDFNSYFSAMIGDSNLIMT